VRWPSVVIAAIVSVAVATSVGAKGPWRGQIVEMETGQPIAGAVVVASWNVRTAGWPHPSEEFLDVAEVVTDADGRFTIPARDLNRRTKAGTAVGPVFKIFKAGYGHFQWRAAASLYPLLDDPVLRLQRAEQEQARLEREGAVFVLPLVKTRQERVAVLERLSLEFAPELIPRLVEAYSRERVFLGLGPYPDKP
jgi:hypothetical protein